MTKISYVHGPDIPTDEKTDRAKLVVKNAEYIPYLSMTQGEMYLALLREQLKIYSAYYPDFPAYKEGIAMVDNALYNGVHFNQINGPVKESLTDIAVKINQAKQWDAPAAGNIYAPRPQNGGIKIGGPIPAADQDCVWYATVQMNKKYRGNDSSKWFDYGQWSRSAYSSELDKYLLECKFKRFVENLLNEKLEDSSHHMLYKSVQSSYPGIGGTAMNLKRILHTSGIQSLGNAAGVDPNLISTWTEIGIIRKNATTTAGPIGSVQSGFFVAADKDGEEAYLKYKNWIEGNSGPRTGAGINLDPATIAAIVTLITAALSAASAIVISINQKEAAVMASAQGFGTPAYSAEKGDLITQLGGSSGNNNTLLYVALAAGAYFLLDDN